MKLVRQAILVLTSAQGERRFEVELCDVGGTFVVNYRQGKAGALRDGTRTVTPVTLAKAERIFADVVKKKEASGFRRLVPAAQQAAAGATTVSSAADPLEMAADAPPADPTIAALAQLQRGRNPPDEALMRARRGAVLLALRSQREPINRTIWRAGELRMGNATPHLLPLLNGDPLRDYCVAWALGRCGGSGSVEALQQLEHHEQAAVQHIAREARRLVNGGAQRKRVADEARRRLPAAIRQQLRTRTSSPSASARQAGPGADATTSDAADEHVSGNEIAQQITALPPAQQHAVVMDLYAIDDATCRVVVMRYAQDVRFVPPLFRSVRQLFKAAEYRQDAELFGLLAHRFVKTPAMYRSPEWGTVIYHQHSSINLKQEQQAASPRVAYSSQTRQYLRRRVWRTLRRLAELADPAYVKMAVGVLLPYRDGDAHATMARTDYSRGWDNPRILHWDTFAPYHTFNHLIYGNSPRYELPPARKAWRCKGTYEPGQPVPDVREESYPHLWDRTPLGLVHLLADSRCRPVHEFAVRALLDNEPAIKALNNATIGQLLAAPYDVTAELGLKLAIQRYSAKQPDHDLIRLAAYSVLTAAREQARTWLDADRRRFGKDHALILALLVCPFSDTRDHIATLLKLATPVDGRGFIVKATAALMGLQSDDTAKDIAASAATTLLEVFPRELRSIGLPIIEDLLAHQNNAVQLFGAQLLVGHDIRPENLPDELLDRLMNADEEEIRAIGMRLFGELPERLLRQRPNLLVALCVSPLADVRDATVPVMKKLAQDATFGAELSVLLCMHLLRKERHRGVHDTLLLLLRDSFGDYLKDVPLSTTLALVAGRSRAAQELGAHLLPQCRDQDIPVQRVVVLSKHELAAVRHWVHGFLSRNVARLKDDMKTAVGVLDSPWDDTREQAFTLLSSSQFDPSDFDCKTLIAMCDSPKHAVQTFGRKLIGQHFQEADGPEYLAKLSEHPSPSLQLFTTNYLNRYASGNREQLEHLRPFFLSVLSRVNRCRPAKTRVLQFLADQVTQGEELAREVATTLTRQSATAARQDKARMIEIMLDIHKRYPDIPLPIKVVAPPVRVSRSAHGGSANGGSAAGTQPGAPA